MNSASLLPGHYHRCAVADALWPMRCRRFAQFPDLLNCFADTSTRCVLLFFCVAYFSLLYVLLYSLLSSVASSHVNVMICLKYNRRRRRCRLSLFVNVLFARRICSRVAGLPGVCYSFAYDSTADAGSGRCDVSLPPDILLLSTSRLKFFCFILRRRAVPSHFMVNFLYKCFSSLVVPALMHRRCRSLLDSFVAHTSHCIHNENCASSLRYVAPNHISSSNPFHLFGRKGVWRSTCRYSPR